MKAREKIVDKKATDPCDKLIFDHGLRIKNLDIYKEMDLMLVVLNNSKVLKLHLSDYPRLKKANKKQLLQWQLIAGGIGVNWTALDEDLSVKGFIKDAAVNSMLNHLSGKEENAIA